MISTYHDTFIFKHCNLNPCRQFGMINSLDNTAFFPLKKNVRIHCLGDILRHKRGLYQNFLKRFDWTTGYRYDNPHDNYVKCLYLCHLSTFLKIKWDVHGEIYVQCRLFRTLQILFINQNFDFRCRNAPYRFHF